MNVRHTGMAAIAALLTSLSACGLEVVAQHAPSAPAATAPAPAPAPAGAGQMCAMPLGATTSTSTACAHCAP